MGVAQGVTEAMLLLVAMMAGSYYWLFHVDLCQHQKGESTREFIAANEDKEEEGNKKKSHRPKRGKKTAATEKSKSSSTTYRPSHPRYRKRFEGHTGTVMAMSISPDGEWIATVDTDNQIRVTTTRSDNSKLYLRTMTERPNAPPAISWSPDGRTAVCSIRTSREIAFFWIRRKADAVPHELVELVKGHFATNSGKGTDIDTCLWDLSHSYFCLVATLHDNTAAWSGMKRNFIGRPTTYGNGMCLSPDGRFICSRKGLEEPSLATKQIQIFKVHRSKINREVEPLFDKISRKSCMTVVPGINNAKVADLEFCDNGQRDWSSSCLLCLGCDDGSIQIWDLNVDYRLREDPKLICSENVLSVRGKKDASTKIIRLATSFVGSTKRIAVATSDGSLHLLTFSLGATSKQQPSLWLDFSIHCAHSEGVGDIQLCPSGNVLYSRGLHSRDIFSWNVHIGNKKETIG